MASSRSLGQLTLDLIANIGGFTAPMSQAARTAQDSLSSIEKSVSSFSENITKALEFAGVTIGIDAVVEGFKNAVEQMDELAKSAQKVGLPVEQFSALAGAAQLSDVATDSLVSTLGKFSKSIATATNSTSVQAKVFDALGISITDSNGQLKSSSDLMLEFSDQFKELGVNTTTTAAGIALFGKNFQAIIPFLSQGSQGIEDAQNEAIALGAVLTGTGAQAAEKFKDDLLELGLASDGLKNQFVQALLPAVTAVADYMVDFAKDQTNVTTATNTLTDTLKVLAAMALIVAINFDVAKAAIQGITAEAAAGIDQLQDIGKGIVGVATLGQAGTKSFGDFWNAISGHGQAGAGVATDAFSNLGKEITSIKGQLTDVFNSIGQGAGPIASATKGLVDLSTQVNQVAAAGAKNNNVYVSSAKQIAALGSAAISAGENVTQVQAIVSAGVTKLQQSVGNSNKLAALQAALNPSAAANADKLANSMQKLGDAVAKAQESSDNASPTQKLYNQYADTVRQLDQLGAAAIKNKGPLQQIQDLVAKGVQGAQNNLTDQLAAQQAQTDSYVKSLNDQITAQQAANTQTAEAVGMGSQQASDQAALNKVMADGSKAINDYQTANAKALAANDPQYVTRLAALKQYYADELTTTQAGQTALASAQADWLNGVSKAMADFVAQQTNVAQIAGTLTSDFLNQGSDAFASFIDGTKSAKDALLDFINSFEQDITQAISKQLLKNLLTTGGNDGSFSLSSLFSFGGGYGSQGAFANGGVASAGSLSRVNERGTELLSVGGKDYLMMGNQTGRITPAEKIKSASAGQTNNFYLAAPTDPRTQSQIANKAAYAQRQASRLG